jgi:hypothetical protein
MKGRHKSLACGGEPESFQTFPSRNHPGLHALARCAGSRRNKFGTSIDVAYNADALAQRAITCRSLSELGSWIRGRCSPKSVTKS